MTLLLSGAYFCSGSFDVRPPSAPLSLDEHAQALGHVCIGWGQLELTLNMLLSSLLFADPPGNPPTGDQVKISQCISANADIREKIRMALAIGYLRRPDDVWFEKLKEVLDRIDNELRPERNRVIHDVWMVSISGSEHDIIRRRIQTRVKRPQASQSTLETEQTTIVAADEIWALSDRIRDANSTVSVVWENFLHPGFLPWL
jgi:hypothetical protein